MPTKFIFSTTEKAMRRAVFVSLCEKRHKTWCDFCQRCIWFWQMNSHVLYKSLWQIMRRRKVLALHPPQIISVLVHMPKVYIAFRYYFFSAYFWPRHSEKPENNFPFQNIAIIQVGVEGAVLNDWSSLCIIQNWPRLDWLVRVIWAIPSSITLCSRGVMTQVCLGL